VASLLVHTARISCRDPDRLDITRKSGGPAGIPFAPSWDILQPVLEARRKTAKFDLRIPEHAREAERLEEEAWAAYVPAFTEEMRRSYRRHRGHWDALLARSRVVLVCYCVDEDGCHRRLLAKMLEKLGATDGGELAGAQRRLEVRT
jgi:hypothetical protein